MYVSGRHWRRLCSANESLISSSFFLCFNHSSYRGIFSLIRPSNLSSSARFFFMTDIFYTCCVHVESVIVLGGERIEQRSCIQVGAYTCLHFLYTRISTYAVWKRRQCFENMVSCCFQPVTVAQSS